MSEMLQSLDEHKWNILGMLKQGLRQKAIMEKLAQSGVKVSQPVLSRYLQKITSQHQTELQTFELSDNSLGLKVTMSYDSNLSSEEKEKLKTTLQKWFHAFDELI